MRRASVEPIDGPAPQQSAEVSYLAQKRTLSALARQRQLLAQSGHDREARRLLLTQTGHCPLEPKGAESQATRAVTRRKVAGIDVASFRELVFWVSNSASNSFFSSSARPFFSAASNAFMVGP